MGRTARVKTAARRTDPRRRGAHPTDSRPHDNAHLRTADLAALAYPTLVGGELDSRRMTYASGRARDVNRCQRRRAEQTDDEREW
jgi:hypothetical protein